MNLIQRVVFAGGPGGGKSTVLEILKQRGFDVAADSARSIIRARKAEGLPSRPGLAEFGQQTLARDVLAYETATNSPSFFERGVVDVAGMLMSSGVLDGNEMLSLIEKYPYHSTVFLFPPWKEIYQTDAERDHAFEHSVTVYGATCDWYSERGYDVIDVTRGPAEARANEVLSILADKKISTSGREL
jgi:predicted ATPase